MNKFRAHKNRIFLITTLAILLCISACRKDISITIDLKKEYYPLNVGDYTIYQIDSITYDNFYSPPRIDTSQTQIKEIVESVFVDLEGRPTYRVEQYRRDTSKGSWEINMVYSATLTDDRLETMVDNLRRIPLIFPVKAGREWNGNSYVDLENHADYLDKWEYIYTTVDETFQVDSFVFDSTLTVQLVDKENLIEKDYFYEYYAKNVGLVYQLSTHLTRQNINGDWDDGFIVVKKVLNYSRQ